MTALAAIRPRTLAQLQRQVARFNAKVAVGDTINFYPIQVGGRLEAAEVSEPGAYVLGGHTAVVRVASRHGCIALSHVVGWGC